MTDLEGDGIVLRRATAVDVDAVLALLTSDTTSEWWPGATRPDILDTVEEGGEAIGFVVEVDGVLAGFIQYWEEDDPQYRHAGIDIALAPEYRDRGLGTEAVRTMARHLFDTVGHHRVVIDPAASNARAIRTYEKVGFRPVGVMRRYERGPDGTWRDGLLMDLLPEELI